MRRVMLLALAAVLAAAGQAQAGFVSFSFGGDAADWPWIGRDFQPGTVTGILNGLVDNMDDQAPTSIEFTSDVSSLGITQSVVTPNFILGGIDIAGGLVKSTTSLLFNFNDPVIGAMQFRLNFENRNVLHWNGSSGPVAGMGNANGFGGATYGTLNDAGPSTAPEPGTMALMGLGSVGMGFAGWRKKRKAALAA